MPHEAFVFLSSEPVYRKHTGSARGHATNCGGAGESKILHSWHGEEIKLVLHPHRIFIHPSYEGADVFLRVLLILKVKNCVIKRPLFAN